MPVNAHTAYAITHPAAAIVVGVSFLILLSWHTSIVISEARYNSNPGIPRNTICCIYSLAGLSVHGSIAPEYLSLSCSGPYPTTGLSGIILKHAFHNTILPVPADSISSASVIMERVSCASFLKSLPTFSPALDGIISAILMMLSTISTASGIIIHLFLCVLIAYIMHTHTTPATVPRYPPNVLLTSRQNNWNVIPAAYNIFSLIFSSMRYNPVITSTDILR